MLQRTLQAFFAHSPQLLLSPEEAVRTTGQIKSLGRSVHVCGPLHRDRNGRLNSVGFKIILLLDFSLPSCHRALPKAGLVYVIGGVCVCIGVIERLPNPVSWVS